MEHSRHRRSPRGERGLKFLAPLRGPLVLASLPSRGAWIEMFYDPCLPSHEESLPSRGAWIEMLGDDDDDDTADVAPLAGSVD